MKLPKKLSKKTLILLLIFGSIIIADLLFYFIPRYLVKNDIVKSSIIKSVVIAEDNTPGLPVRLKIPSINVDVALEYVGVTTAGAMDIPKSTDKVGWFELGKRPGEIGSAVLAGHYGLYAGKPSAFDNLHNLVAGDKIYVDDDEGKTISFVVRESRNYDPKSDATEVFSSDDEQSHLNLITCEGIWNKDVKSFPKRLVIFADKE